MEQESFGAEQINPYLEHTSEALGAEYQARLERWKPITTKLFELWGAWAKREHALEDLPYNAASAVFAQLRMAELKAARDSLADLVSHNVAKMVNPGTLVVMDAHEQDLVAAAELIARDAQDLELYNALVKHDTLWLSGGPLLAQADFSTKMHTDVVSLLRTRFPSVQVDAGSIDTLIAAADGPPIAGAETPSAHDEHTRISAQDKGKHGQKSLLDIIDMEERLAQLRALDDAEKQ